MGKHSGILTLIAILVLAPCVLGKVTVDGQPSAQGDNALRLMIPSPEEYAFAGRTIPRLTINQSAVEFHLSAMILRYQSNAPAILFQVDLQGGDVTSQSLDLRYSFRFASDGSVLFYYPFMDSAAAVTKQKGWSLGKWCRLTTIVSKDSAKFYVDGQMVAQSDSQNPPRSNGFSISHLGLGKTERQRLSVEAFVSEISLVQNGTMRFLEKFESDLRAYQVRKSQNALLQVISSSRYASIEAYASPQTASAGDTILLGANLFDISFKGVGGKQVSFERLATDTWIKIAEARSLDNGTVRAFWRIPANLKEEISIRAHYPGDDRLLEAVSTPFTVLIVPQTGTGFETTNLVLALLSLFIVGSVLLSSRFGYSRILRSLIPIFSSVAFLFSIPILTSSVMITAFMAYTQRTIRLQIFGPQIDNLVWTLSIMLMAGAWIILQNKAVLHRRSALIPALLAISSLVFQNLGRDLARALLGVLSAITIILYPLARGDSIHPSKPRDFALKFSGAFLSMIFAVEIGSAAGWVYNTFDPHVPFDGESRWLAALLEANLFSLLYPMTLPALVILMFSWAWFPLLRFLTRPLNRLKSLIVGDALTNALASSEVTRQEYMKAEAENMARSSGGPRYLTSFTILAVVCCSLFLVYYPYFYAVRLIGVDTPWYHRNLVEMSSPGGFNRVLSDYGAASRLPYLLILYIIQKVTSFSPMLVVKLGPAVPAAFLGVSTLFLIRTVTRDAILASFSAFLGLFSIATTVAVYAGIFANWLALGWVALFFGLLVRSWSQPSPQHIIAATLASIVILLTHAWTWAVVLASIIVLEGFNMVRQVAARRRIIPSESLRSNLPIIAVNILLLLLVVSIFARGEFMSLSKTALDSVSLINLSSFPSALLFTFQYYVGGFFADPIVILPAILGLAALKHISRKFSLLVCSLLFLTSIPLLLLGSWWQWRLLYMVPYQVLASLGLVGVSRKVAGSSDRLVRFCGALLMLVILLASLNYSLRCLNYIPS